MLHCTLSFSLKNSSLSLSLCLYVSHSLSTLYAENRGRGFDRPVNLGLQVGRTEVEGIARAAWHLASPPVSGVDAPLSTLVPLCPCSHSSRPLPLRASLSPFPFCFPARFRPLPATLIGKASKSAKWTRSKCVNNYWLINCRKFKKYVYLLSTGFFLEILIIIIGFR